MKIAYFPLFILLALLAYSFGTGNTPYLVSVVFVVSSLVSYALYYKDKRAAKSGRWRVPENTLHLVSLFCGWPGALLAQQRLRHKTVKQNFRILFWLTVAANFGVLIWLHSLKSSPFMHDF